MHKVYDNGLKMNRFVFSDEAPKQWGELCSNSGDFFNTTEWQGLLTRGFSSKTCYGLNEETGAAFTITLFKAGPFNVGYVGFPVGGTVGDDPMTSDMIKLLKKALFPFSIHCLRLPVSSFVTNSALMLPARTTRETAICNLKDWNPEASSKLRRIINKKKSQLDIIDASDLSQGKTLFKLYHATVKRHHGSMRYNEKYFKELIKLSIKDSRLRCLLAKIDNNIIGFIVVACHCENAYYMHGGMDYRFRQFYPSDILFMNAILWAKQKDMVSFNMMASPENQQSLVSYKEKWGGITKDQKIYELDLSVFKAKMFRVVEKIHNLVS